MGPCFKSYLFYKFDRPETVRDRAKMNLAGHCVRRLSRNYFKPCFLTEIIISEFAHHCEINFLLFYYLRY